MVEKAFLKANSDNHSLQTMGVHTSVSVPVPARAPVPVPVHIPASVRIHGFALIPGFRPGLKEPLSKTMLTVSRSEPRDLLFLLVLLSQLKTLSTLSSHICACVSVRPPILVPVRAPVIGQTSAEVWNGVSQSRFPTVSHSEVWFLKFLFRLCPRSRSHSAPPSCLCSRSCSCFPAPAPVPSINWEILISASLSTRSLVSPTAVLVCSPTPALIPEGLRQAPVSTRLFEELFRSRVISTMVGSNSDKSWLKPWAKLGCTEKAVASWWSPGTSRAPAPTVRQISWFPCRVTWLRKDLTRKHFQRQVRDSDTRSRRRRIPAHHGIFSQKP